MSKGCRCVSCVDMVTIMVGVWCSTDGSKRQHGFQQTTKLGADEGEISRQPAQHKPHSSCLADSDLMHMLTLATH